MMGLMQRTPQGTGLLAPQEDESENQPAQTMEAILKKKREKLAQDKLGIQPEDDPYV